MDCNTPISWEAIIRNAARVNDTDPTCYALAIREGDANGGVDCDHPPLLTMFAAAWDTDAILVDTSTDGYDQKDCMDAVGIITLAMSAILTGDTNSLKIVEDDSIDASCGMSCDDTEATSAMIAGTFVNVGSETRTLVSMVSGFSKIDCDGADVGLETILRGAIIKIARGQYAWRVQSEA